MSNTPHPFGAPARLIDVGHSQVAYYRVGRGPDLLWIHGWPLHAGTFRAVVPLLSDSYTCHLVDLPGTGQSVWNEDSQIGMRDNADTLLRVVEALQLSRYAIVAHDSGALVAQLLAAGDPRVCGLVLGNTEIPGYRPWQIGLYMALTRIPLGALVFRMSLRLRLVRHSAIAYGGCFHDVNFCEGEFRRLFIEPLAEPRAFAGQLRLIEALSWSALDAWSEVPKQIRAPVKFVWGAEDPFFPLEKLRPTLTHYRGGASLSVIDSAKLFVHEERPERFASEARSLLQSSFDGQVAAAV